MKLTINEREIIITALDFIEENWNAFVQRYEERTGEVPTDSEFYNTKHYINTMNIKR